MFFLMNMTKLACGKLNGFGMQGIMLGALFMMVLLELEF